MLPLHYLDDNRELARSIAEHWDWDLTSEAWFDHFRISSNAIYPLRVRSGEAFQRAILRFAPASEKSLERLESELAWMSGLRAQGMPVSEHALSRHGLEAHCVETPWGVYVANVFLALEGSSLEDAGLTPERAFRVGALLGTLHNKTQVYTAQYPETLTGFTHVVERCNHIANNCDGIVALADDFYALAKRIKMDLELLRAETNPEHMGLIHYDFELDNLLYCDKTDTLGIVDFDDAMVSWLDMDLIRLLDNIAENCQDSCEPDALLVLQHQALAGYHSQRKNSSIVESGNLTPGITGDARIQLLRGFMDLNWIYRVHYSLKTHGDNEPQWMQGLRGRLTQRADHKLEGLRRSFIGK